MPNQLRAVLPLDKVQVTEIVGDAFKFRFFNNTITVKLANLGIYDVRPGDMLTLYTELLIRKERQ